MSTSLISSIGVIGLGLIGGSFARALKLTNTVESVLGFDLREQEVNTALRLGVIDVACPSIAQLVVNSDVIVLATPVKAVEIVLREIAPCLHERHVITDVGSVKGVVVEAVINVFGRMLPGFVPGHPIAGSEKSGVAAATPGLFKNHKTILTPLSATSREALDIVTRLWQAADAQVLMMSPTHHDEVLAATSHLPHLIAFSLVDTLAGDDNNKDIFRYAAGGFRDFTRIAASDPVMWHDIFLSNRPAILQVIDDFNRDLDKLRHAIESRDGETLLGVFTRAKAAREHFSNMLAGRGYKTAEVKSPQEYFVDKCSAVKGDIRLCGDKSISHRVVVLGALARGITRIEGFFESESSLATLQAFRDMGVVIEGPDRGRIVIHGVGLYGLKRPAGPLYVGHSGTSMKLLSGVMCGQSFSSEIVGDDTIQQQSMADIASVLNALGAAVELGDESLPPVIINGEQRMVGREFTLTYSNARVKSCLLLAAIYAEGTTVINDVQDAGGHSEQLLAGFDYPIVKKGHQIHVKGHGQISAKTMEIPADFSLAFYFMVAASIIPKSDLVLRQVGLNSSRTKALTVLQNMGAQIDILGESQVVNEAVADIRIQSAALRGFVLTHEDCLQAGKEVPALLLAAGFATAKSRITGFSKLPVSLQKTIQQSAEGISVAGGIFSFEQDDLIISPHAPGVQAGDLVAPNNPGGALACIFALSCTGEGTLVKNCAGLISSYPEVVSLANEVGFKLRST